MEFTVIGYEMASETTRVMHVEFASREELLAAIEDWVIPDFEEIRVVAILDGHIETVYNPEGARITPENHTGIGDDGDDEDDDEDEEDISPQRGPVEIWDPSFLYLATRQLSQGFNPCYAGEQYGPNTSRPSHVLQQPCDDGLSV